jgi:hypothetical protein
MGISLKIRRQWAPRDIRSHMVGKVPWVRKQTLKKKVELFLNDGSILRYLLGAQEVMEDASVFLQTRTIVAKGPIPISKAHSEFSDSQPHAKVRDM